MAEEVPPAFRLYRKGIERENLPGSDAGRVPSWAPNFCWHFWKRPNVWLSSPHRPASSPWGYFYISLQTGLLPTFEKRGPAPSIRRRPAAKKGVCKMSKSTVFPTRDRPWLRFYAAGANRVAINVPQGLTIWQFVEKEMRRLGDGTAIEYFGRKITRKEFVRQVERWACVFHNLGVQEEEVVCLYGPTIPEFCYIAFALNRLGAVPYFLKLSASRQALEEESADSHIAVVFDGMWDVVSDTFSQPRFSHVLFVAASDSMPVPLRSMVALGNRKKVHALPRGPRYGRTGQLLHRYGRGAPPVAAFCPGRTAFITSSSGTSSAGMVKGIMTTNEAAIAQVLQAVAAKFTFTAEDCILNNLPLTASSSLNFQLIWALYLGVPITMDPRLSEENFYSQVLHSHCTIASLTGAYWETFFHKVEEQIAAGKAPDLSRLRMPIIGGEGTTPEKLAWMDSLLQRCGGQQVLSGYGLSEAFSTIAYPLGTADEDKEYGVICAGLPYPGVIAGVFDEAGRELPCGQRGELWLRTPTMMKGYYKKDALTAKALANGWLHTGDLFAISESGRLYCYGRLSDHVVLKGRRVYLFDLAAALRKSPLLRDVLVNAVNLADGQAAIMIHVLLNEKDKPLTGAMAAEYLEQWNRLAAVCLPRGTEVTGFKIQHEVFRNSATTAKLDRSSYLSERGGYIQLVKGKLLTVELEGDPAVGCTVCYGVCTQL